MSGVVSLVGCELLCGVHRVTSSLHAGATATAPATATASATAPATAAATATESAAAPELIEVAADASPGGAFR